MKNRKPILAQDSERLIVMLNEDTRFRRAFWKAILMCVASGAFIAICLVLIGLVAYYGREYKW